MSFRLSSRMCVNVGIPGVKTNHSLKATCATRLYQENVDEQMIMERTGHRSIGGVRAYKRTSDIHVQKCSAILDSGSIEELSTIARGSIPTHEKVGLNFIFKDCSVTIHNNSC